MAEIAVLAVDPIGVGPDKAFFRGDIISVRPDGYQWEKKMIPPTFIRLHVPSLSVEQILGYREHDRATMTEQIPAAIRKMKKFNRRLAQVIKRPNRAQRKWRLNLDGLNDGDTISSLPIEKRNTSWR